MLEIIMIVLLVVTGIEGLITFLAKHPGSERLMVGGGGLCLALGMTITGLIILADPGLDDGLALLFFMWAELGVCFVVKSAKEKWWLFRQC